MIKYTCTIKEFSEITPPGYDGKQYRFRIETISQEKINQPDEKQYQEVHQIDIECVGTLIGCWGFDISNLEEVRDLKKVLCEYTRRHFIEQFSKGELSKSSKLDLHTGNTPSECPYDPEKIQCSVGDVFEVEVTPKIGF